MSEQAPHYLLFSESVQTELTDREEEQANAGKWRFVLETIDGSDRLAAADEEVEVSADRLALLAVVRGLEALDQPSRVTLVTPSRYVTRGLRYGLNDWRDNKYHWEHHGSWKPIKNRDLWQRVGQALDYHELECRVWRFDLPNDNTGPPRPHFLRRNANSDETSTTDETCVEC